MSIRASNELPSFLRKLLVMSSTYIIRKVEAHRLSYTYMEADLFAFTFFSRMYK